MSGRFQLCSATVIVFDVVTMVLEVSDPSNSELFFAPDQLMLCFYILELVARSRVFRFKFLSGPCNFVAWNLLDLVVVFDGVFMQWVVL